jgi:hypothetical protein
MQRAISMKPDGTWEARQDAPYAIFDEWWGDFCALPKALPKPVKGKRKSTPSTPPELIPLEWKTRDEALSWLEHCGNTWRAWQAQGSEHVPEHWAGFSVPQQSPWAGYTTPITPYN